MQQEIGPVVGLHAPEFTLHDEKNQSTPLKGIMGEKGLLLAFIHGTWCSHCVQTLYRLRRHSAFYEQAGIRLSVIAIDPPSALRVFKMSANPPLAYTLLADEDEQVHKLYELEHVGAYIVIDAAGIVRSKFLDFDHHGWPGHARVLEAFAVL